jgi:hypothetical protein
MDQKGSVRFIIILTLLGCVIVLVGYRMVRDGRQGQPITGERPKADEERQLAWKIAKVDTIFSTMYPPDYMFLQEEFSRGREGAFCNNVVGAIAYDDIFDREIGRYCLKYNTLDNQAHRDLNWFEKIYGAPIFTQTTGEIFQLGTKAEVILGVNLFLKAYYHESGKNHGFVQYLTVSENRALLFYAEPIDHGLPVEVIEEMLSTLLLI